MAKNRWNGIWIDGMYLYEMNECMVNNKKKILVIFNFYQENKN